MRLTQILQSFHSARNYLTVSFAKSYVRKKKKTHNWSIRKNLCSPNTRFWKFTIGLIISFLSQKTGIYNLQKLPPYIHVLQTTSIQISNYLITHFHNSRVTVISMVADIQCNCVEPFNLKTDTLDLRCRGTFANLHMCCTVILVSFLFLYFFVGRLQICEFLYFKEQNIYHLRGR